MSIITILDASPKKLTKQFSLNSNGEVVKSDYDRCWAYEYKFADCHTVDDLHELLSGIANEPSLCIIRGQLKPGWGTTSVTRKKSAEDSPFRENPDGVSFAMMDFDKIPIPDWLPTDLDYYLEYLVSLLPEYLHNVSYVYQWSSSAGMDGWETLRCHIWFWLEEPRTDSQMVLWAKSINLAAGKNIVDESTLRTVQPNYTASPIFNNNITDPLMGKRIGLVRKSKGAALIPIMVVPEKKQGGDNNTQKPFSLEQKNDYAELVVGRLQEVKNLGYPNVLTFVTICKSIGLSYAEYDYLCAMAARSDSSLKTAAIREQAWDSWDGNRIGWETRDNFLVAHGARPIREREDWKSSTNKLYKKYHGG